MDLVRPLFEAEHEAFRATVATFLDQEVVPHHDAWEAAGVVDRAVWAAAGAQGLLGLSLPEEYGGGGTADFRFNAVIGEEQARRGVYGPAFTLLNDMVAPYLALATPEQAARWLPGVCAGTTIGAIAMTEPDAGSDLQALRTRARDDGDAYVLDGAKTFISHGVLADLVVVVARTGEGGRGLTLLVVERGMPGFSRGRHLDKIGLRAQDTAELVFEGVRVPKANRLGEEGAAFGHLMAHLPTERLSIAVTAAAASEALLTRTLAYVRTRTTFGTPVGSHQANKHLLAELATETRVARVFVDDCLRRQVEGGLDAATASMAKWWTTELQQRVADRCLQLHGGYGYLRDYAVARAFVDGRVQSIYGGTTEIQKEIIGRSLGL